MRPERVLLAYRDDVDAQGGAASVMHATARALRARGVEVDVTYELEPDVDGYDLVHVFNLWEPPTALEQLRHLARTGVPVVWLPFYLHLCEYAWVNRVVYEVYDPARTEDERRALLAGMADGSTVCAGMTRFLPNEVYPGFHDDLREMVSLVDHLTVISHHEVQMLFRTLGLHAKPFTVTPHGVEPLFADAGPEPFRELVGDGEFVLCVGAVEPRKNQLLLVEALRGTGVELVLLGPCFEPQYLEHCLREGGGAVRHFDRLPRELVASALKAAAVHALPSFAEGAALANLEAAAAGTPLVVSNRSSEFEYFGDLPFYCEPTDPASIRAAVFAAIESRGDASRWTRLAERMRDYTWDSTAEATLTAYERTLSARAQIPAAFAGVRAFAVAAEAEELLARPELLAEFGDVFGQEDDVTLVVRCGSRELPALVALVERLGLDREDAADVLVVDRPPPPALVRARLGSSIVARDVPCFGTGDRDALRVAAGRIREADRAGV